MQFLHRIDEYLFFVINSWVHLRSIYAIAPYWRSMYLWVPLYTFFIVYLLQHYGSKGLVYLLFLVGVVAISDTTSSKLIKPAVHRERPCRDSVLSSRVKMLVPCGSGYSFPSSHSTNHFAGVVFVILTLGFKGRFWKRLLLIWAGSIALGQVYVGVHYPSDVLFGAVLGSGIGWFIARVYHWVVGSQNLVSSE